MAAGGNMSPEMAFFLAKMADLARKWLDFSKILENESEYDVGL